MNIALLNIYCLFEAIERATYTSKSFLIALAFVMRHITVEQAALASTVEVTSQVQKWGEVEDCTPSKFLFPLSYSHRTMFPAHDVDYHDIRRQLGSIACLLSRI